MSNFKNQLAHIFQKFPFVHFDKAGELSIIVPLTGARKITGNFSKDANKPVTLFMFGDNTCKSDLERRKFFFGTVTNPSSSYTTLFPKLIQELEQLNSNAQISTNNRKLLKSIIQNLTELNEKTNIFQRGNPGYEEMKTDLKHGDEIFVSTGEFIVRVPPDYARQLILPNVMTIANSSESLTRKMIPQEMMNDCLNSLSKIKEPIKIDSLLLIPEIIKEIPNIRDFLSSKNKQSPKELFKKIYQAMQKQDDTLKDQMPEVFENMQINWSYFEDENEDYDLWTDLEITDATASVFNQANILNEASEVKQNSFEAIYQRALNQYLERNQDPQNLNFRRRNTYQLFVLQTFLYLCAIELRLKNKESAKRFLNIFQDKETITTLIETLCTDEKSFRAMMTDTFQLSGEEYQLIVDATYEIATDHLEADHFDELRTACSLESVNNAQYLIMGGCLCWSTVPITEDSNINSLEQQKRVSKSHFDIFYNKRATYIRKSVAFQLIKELLAQNILDESAQQKFLTHIPHLSKNQKMQILVHAIKDKKYQHAQFLIEHSTIEFSPKAFIATYKQIPLPTDLIKLFLKTDQRYAQYIGGENLIRAAKNGELTQVKLILKNRPDLLEYEDQFKQTALLWACSTGQVEVVKYLMTAGANIHSRTVVPLDYSYRIGETPFGGRTAREWAEHHLNKTDPAKASMIKALFDNYYQQMEANFVSNPSYKDNFTTNHLTQAITNGDLNLITLFLNYCPHLKDQFSDEDLIRANKQYEQRKLRTQIMPYQEEFNVLLETLQIKMKELAYKSRDTDYKLNRTIFKLNKELTKARNQFFNYEITPESFQKFKGTCKHALQDAKPILAQHRGWHTFPAFIRAVLGILSVLTIIPALAIQYSTTNGFQGVFFEKKEKIQTDSTKKLNEFEENLQLLTTDISTKLN